MKYISGIWILLILGCGPGKYSQKTQPGDNEISSCTDLYRNGDWAGALTCLRSLPEDLKDQSYYDLQGSARMNLGQYPEAVTDFEKALQLDTAHRNHFLYFKLGESLWNAHHYQDAGRAFQRYREIVHSPRPDIQKQVDYYIRSAHIADSLYRQPRSFDLVPLSSAINSELNELGLSMTYDHRYMVLTRRSNQEDLYESHFLHGEWTPAMPISVLNTRDNEGAVSLSGDGQLLVFTACNRPGNVGSCDLYFSSMSDTGWTAPELMPVVNSPGWDSQPTLSPDGKVIIFSSDRPGGYGGRDLWLSVMGDQEWIPPINLGENINSPGHEENPFLHSDQNTLYFTSDYWPGFGGRDIFMSHRIVANQWSANQNLGYPINSHQNEEGIFVSTSGLKGYFASAREGDFDIYTFEMDPSIRPDASFLFQMVVKDEDTDRSVTSATVDVFDWTSKHLVRSVKTDPEGYAAFLMAANREYGITISKRDYIIYSYRRKIGGTIDSDLTDTIYLNPIAETQTLVLQNVHFETGEARLLPGSETELDQVARYLREHPQLIIRLTGHTDDVGQAEDNLVLSKARAQSVMDYLVNQGLNPARITVEGKGESEPVASNETEEGRQQNRRTELTIIR